MFPRTAFTITVNPKIPPRLKRLEELANISGIAGIAPHVRCFRGSIRIYGKR